MSTTIEQVEATPTWIVMQFYSLQFKIASLFHVTDVR